MVFEGLPGDIVQRVVTAATLTFDSSSIREHLLACIGSKPAMFFIRRHTRHADPSPSTLFFSVSMNCWWGVTPCVAFELPIIDNEQRHHRVRPQALLSGPLRSLCQSFW
jgi:hypothetical protein